MGGGSEERCKRFDNDLCNIRRNLKQVSLGQSARRKTNTSSSVAFLESTRHDSSVWMTMPRGTFISVGLKWLAVSHNIDKSYSSGPWAKIAATCSTYSSFHSESLKNWNVELWNFLNNKKNLSSLYNSASLKQSNRHSPQPVNGMPFTNHRLPECVQIRKLVLFRQFNHQIGEILSEMFLHERFIRHPEA